MSGHNYNQDMTVPCGSGLINIRVGAIILKAGRVLMVTNEHTNHYYSVGGRVQFGETVEEALLREVREETGLSLKIDRLGFVYQHYFIGHSPENMGKTVFELSLYYYMRTPRKISPVCTSSTSDGRKERLQWVSLDEETEITPSFFRTELRHPRQDVRYITSDERNAGQEDGRYESNSGIVIPGIMVPEYA